MVDVRFIIISFLCVFSYSVTLKTAVQIERDTVRKSHTKEELMINIQFYSNIMSFVYNKPPTERIKYFVDFIL